MCSIIGVSLSNGQKALLITGIAAGVYAIGKAVTDAVQDFSKNFKFFISGFSINGFPRDPNGKLLLNTLRTTTRVGLYNQSMVSLRISDIWLSVEYYDRASKTWYPFAASAKVKDQMTIPAKQTSNDQFVLDVNLTELAFSKFWQALSGPIPFKVVAVFSVYGTRQRAEQTYNITFPAQLVNYLKTIFGGRGTGSLNGRPAWVNEIWYGDQSINAGVGYTASKKRTLKPGHEYTPLIEGSHAPNKRVVIDPNASVEKTVQLLDQIATETRYQTKKLADRLYHPSIQRFASNIWQFLYDHVQYKLDKDGEEELREPARAWKDRTTGVDCDCYALFVSTLLKNKGIPHFFRVVKMYGRSNYQHIYVVIPHSANWKYNDPRTYTVIDPVMEFFGADPENVTGILDVKAKI